MSTELLLGADLIDHPQPAQLRIGHSGRVDDLDSGTTPVPEPVGRASEPRWFLGLALLGAIVFAILVFGGSGGGLSVGQRAAAALAAIGAFVFFALVKGIRER